MDALLQYPVFLHVVDHIFLNDYYNLCLVNKQFYTLCTDNGIAQRFKDRVSNKILNITFKVSGLNFVGVIVTKQFNLKWSFNKYFVNSNFYNFMFYCKRMIGQEFFHDDINEISVKDLLLNFYRKMITQTNMNYAYIFDFIEHSHSRPQYPNLRVYINDELRLEY